MVIFVRQTTSRSISNHLRQLSDRAHAARELVTKHRLMPPLRPPPICCSWPGEIEAPTGLRFELLSWIQRFREAREVELTNNWGTEPLRASAV